MPTQMGADAHDASGVAAEAAAFKSEGYTFVAQYIDQYPDASTAGSPSLTLAQVQREAGAGLQIMSIFQTAGMSSSSGAGYQTYFTAAQGTKDAAEALSSAQTLTQPPGSTIYFAMDFDPHLYGEAGSEKQLLTDVQTYLSSVAQALQGSGYEVGVYGSADTLAAAIRNSASSPYFNPAYSPVAVHGWLSAGSNSKTNPNSMGWDVYQQAQTTASGVAIDPDTADTIDFGQWTVCFASGTCISTTRGEIAVEDLVVGDLVTTASGEYKPIRWLGHRKIDCRRRRRPGEVMPVRIAAHAFGVDRPSHDLALSPGHSVCVDVLGEVLIPCSALINGATIVQEDVQTVTYWHVELDTHEVILAANLPCESYLDMGNRSFFAQAQVTELQGAPDSATGDHSGFCRPFVDSGGLVAFVRERLAARAVELGWCMHEDTFADLHLMVDGRRIDPEVQGLSARFTVPSGAGALWLSSDSEVAAHVGFAEDWRRLGVCIAGLAVNDGFSEPLSIAPDDARLSIGFHAPEPGPQRWTAGRALLAAELWKGLVGAFFLTVDLARPALPRWVAPSHAGRSSTFRRQRSARMD